MLLGIAVDLAGRCLEGCAVPLRLASDKQIARPATLVIIVCTGSA
jgi:hypothetical protein